MMIETDRLNLVPLTAEQLKLWVDDLPLLEKELDCTYLAEPIEGFFLNIIKRQIEITEKDEGNYLYHSFLFIIRKSDKVVVGSSSFKNVPNENGEVEIGYGLGKLFEHSGYMTETVKAMCDWALTQDGISSVIAETAIGNQPSEKVLQRCGFVQYKETEGALWWRRNAMMRFTLETERLQLRPLDIKDIETVHSYASDIENTKYMVYLPNDTIEETKQFLEGVTAEWQKEKPMFYEFAVILDKKHIGAVSVSLDESRQEGELGWIINKTYHGNGYATEAAIAVLDFAINKLNVKRVIAHCDYRNEPSYNVMEKIGLSLESSNGTRRNKGSNREVQELMYSLEVGFQTRPNSC